MTQSSFDATANITSRPLSPHVGAEIIGLDAEGTITPEARRRILDVWIDAGVLLFRNVRSDAAQMALSQLFGELRPAANADLNNPENPYLMERVYDPADPSVKPSGLHLVEGKPIAGWIGWHWDQAFMPEIVRGAALRMIQPPYADGLTGFIDAIGAYERLPDALKDEIENLEVVYEFTGAAEKNIFGFPSDIQVLPGSSIKDTPGDPSRFRFPPSVHPLVLVQPETGRKVLKLSPMHAKYICGMDMADSDALLHRLADHLVDDRYAYYHDWQPDDMMLWDNWRVIHCYTGVPLDATRRTRRTTIAGDYARGRYLHSSDETARPKRFIDD